MRLARRTAFVVGLVLLGLGVAASLQAPEGGDLLGLRLFPALLLPLKRPFIGGGDFPPSLSGTGIVAVYVIPGALLVALAFLFRDDATGPRHDEGA